MNGLSGTTPSAGRDHLDSKHLIPVLASSFATTWALAREVKRGGAIALMADAPLARSTLSVEFLGRRAHLPAIVPRLIQTYNLPSFWCCPLWRNGRVALELERLPDPEPGEARKAWTRRWFRAYLARLEGAMRGRPENLGLSSGIWANVNRAILEERRRRLAKRRRRPAQRAAAPRPLA